MELRDLFKKRDNYVDIEESAPIDPLKAFFDERIPKSKIPVPEKKVEEIDKAYSLAPKPLNVEQQPMEGEPDLSSSMYSSEKTKTPVEFQRPSYVSASDLLDVDKIKKQVDQLVPKEMDWKDALANLSPAILELLVGGTAKGIGTGLSAKALMSDLEKKDARRKTLEEKLMELKEIKYPKIDAESGRQARFEAAQREKRSLEDRKLVIQTRDKLNQDKVFQEARGRYSATNDAINVLNQRNPIGDAAVRSLFAKGIFREVGALSDSDKRDYIGSPQYERAFDRMLSKYKNGTLGEEDRTDLLKLARHMRERSKKDAFRVASSYTSGIKSFGIDPSAVINPLLATDDIAPQFAQPKTAKKVPPPGMTFEQFKKWKQENE